ncbi:MAG TPA: hypothetical protein V6C65_41950 [Allocoleopsis sp.]
MLSHLRSIPVEIPAKPGHPAAKVNTSGSIAPALKFSEYPENVSVSIRYTYGVKSKRRRTG